MNNQILINNENSLIQLRKNILKDNPKNVLLFTGKKSFKNSGAQKKIDKVLKGFSFFRYSDFDINPNHSDLIKCLDLLNNQTFDYTICIGGGSVIDFAKLVNIGLNNDNIFTNFPNNTNKIHVKGNKFIAIPTTSGSGTEATHFAVLYHNRTKFSVSNQFLYPDIVYLDSTLTYSMNSHQTAISGIDAFCQSIESYWSINSTEESLKYSLSSLKLILKYLPKAVNENCRIAKKNMIYASYLAGKAINISKTTGAHALSYFLTSNYNIPHGQAVALTIAEWYSFNISNKVNIVDKRGLNYYNNKMKIMNLLFSKNDDKILESIKKFIKKCNLSVRLSDFNIDKKHLSDLINNVNLQRLSNNPVAIDKKQTLNILIKSL
jgi:alcohol dehydrogenase